MLSRNEVEKMAEILDGMPVWGCIPGSPAQKAGIRYGDILLRINGREVSSYQDYVEAQKLDDQKMTAQVAREGEILDLELNLRDPQWRPSPEKVFQKIAKEGYMSHLLDSADSDGPGQKPN